MSNLVTQMLGECENHIDTGSMSVPMHHKAVSIFKKLQHDASSNGFELAFASGFRSFERQLMIWNAKAAGQRAVLNPEGKPLDIKSLTEDEVVFAILHFSALPGSSRHHWGTEVDIFDQGALQNEQKLALTIDETKKGGAFEKMYEWLDSYLKNNSHLSRPYDIAGAVACEPWHISACNIAQPYSLAMNESTLYEKIKATPSLALRKTVLKNFEKIYHQYVFPYLTTDSK